MQRIPVIVTIVFLVVMPVLANESDDIVGLWATDPEGEGGQAHIRIYAESGRYAGKIVWLEEPVYTAEDDDGEVGEPKVDTNNPDPALRSKPIMGLELMKGFEYVGKRTWKKGTIYDPDNGKTYQCKIKLGDDDILYVRGFIGVSMIGRTSQWTRVRDEN